MYDKVLAIETLKNIENSLQEIIEWSRDIVSVDDFTTSPNGMILLNAVCMKILAVGEEIKGLDRRTGGELLKHYPTIEWKEVKGMRDIIAHRYFSLDADVIFSVIKVDIHPLLEVIQQMKNDLIADENIMKFELSKLTDYNEEEIINEIKRVAQLVERPLTIEKFDAISKCHSTTIRKRFGSWSSVLKKAGLDSSYRARNSENSIEEIIKELIRVSEKLNKNSFTRKEFEANSDMNKYVFKGEKGFNKMMKLAGLEIPTISRKYTDKERFENLLNVWTYFGEEPNYAQMKEKPSVVGPKSYVIRWGSWRKALKAFVDFINTDNEHELEAKEKNLDIVQNTGDEFIHKTKRQPSERLKVQVLMRDGNKCRLCGITLTGEDIHFDHIKPWSKGGETVLENLQVLCKKHNLAKGDLEYQTQ